MLKKIIKTISFFLLCISTLLNANALLVSNNLLLEYEKDQTIVSIIEDIQERLLGIDDLIKESPQAVAPQIWLENSNDILWGNLVSENDLTGSYQKAYDNYSEAHKSLVSGDLLSTQTKLIDAYQILKSVYESNAVYDYFEQNPYMAREEKAAVRPYLLPPNNPIKKKLDSIFFNNRPLHSAETFTAAGFISKFIQPRSFIRVASHPKIPGFLFKVYLDSESRSRKSIPGWKWFVNRAKNAKVIDNFIKANKIKHFTVAKKWIYPVPVMDFPFVTKPDPTLKNEILVVSDMKLVSEMENKIAWKTVITKRHLDEFLAIIQHAGGSSYRPRNVAYTKKGNFAFIDTEYTTKIPNYNSILPYLSPTMAAYWKKITK